MFTHVPSVTLTILIIFSLVSIFVCTAQIFMRKMLQFLSLCNVSIFIPLLSIFIWATSETSHALYDLSPAGDLSEPIVHGGVSALLASISVGLTVTIFLAVYYAITKAICENYKKAIEKLT